MLKHILTACIATAIALAAGAPAARALSLKGVVAYPVPFNPDTRTLSLKNAGGPDPVTNSVKIEIFDINGDSVFSRQYSSLSSFKWNGRNGAGRKVKPGMYIIKVTAEDANDGGYDRKMIRILVDY
ncbi:MAG TPA: T9SS type A sorting domain-containing protein [Spirochaetes bacterium]|nr:T9SS type A sorting domain-containing protein [Spirochaetota bacterium]